MSNLAIAIIKILEVKDCPKKKMCLCQDRVNLYRYGGDPEDQSEHFFHTGEGRNTMEYLEIHSVDMSYASLEEVIVNETPLVEVDIRHNGLYVKIIQR